MRRKVKFNFHQYYCFFLPCKRVIGGMHSHPPNIFAFAILEYIPRIYEKSIYIIKFKLL